MVKRQTRNSLAQKTDKGKQKMVQPTEKNMKRERKTKEEVLLNLSTTYSLGNSSHVKQQIHGWEREIQQNEEDSDVEAEILDFVTNPGNNRGRLSLFNQTVHTYWIAKFLIAKTM